MKHNNINSEKIEECLKLLIDDKSYNIFNKYMGSVPRETKRGAISYLIKEKPNEFNKMLIELSNNNK